MLLLVKSQKVRKSMPRIVKPDQIPLPKEHGTPSRTENSTMPIQHLIRVSPKRSIIIETIASMTDTELVSAANNTSVKKSAPIKRPPAICEKTFGSVINIRPAPPCDIPASPLKMYTAGTTISPASRAITVSKISIWLTDFTMLTSSRV